MQQFQQIIEEAWENRASLQPGSAPAKVGEAVSAVLAELDAGRLRVAEKLDGANGKDWVTHQWIKKAVLLSFRLEDNKLMDGVDTYTFAPNDTLNRAMVWTIIARSICAAIPDERTVVSPCKRPSASTGI